jgi:hypothetical protein
MRWWSALAVAAILLASVPLSIVAASYPRQVDPSAAPEEIPYGPGLAQFYGLVLASLSGGNFTGARSLLLESGLLHIPSSISYILQRFNSLIDTAGSLLQSASSDLSSATALVDEGRLSEASRFIDSARGELLQANQTVQQLQAAALQAAQNTGMPLSLLTPRISALESLVERYSMQIASLEVLVSASSFLVQTTVTLSVRPSAAPVGSSVLFSGSLSSYGGQPLAGRTVSIYLAGSRVATATTESDGSFSVSFRLPFIYETNVTAFASFLPSGPDSAVYSPSSSHDVHLSLLFTTPRLSLSAQPVVYPGIPFTVSGRTSVLSGPVELSAFGLHTSTVPDGSGYFSFLVSAPAGQPAGQAQLTVSTHANGTVAPSSASVTVLVTRLMPSTSLAVPSFAVVGIPLRISGQVSINGTGLAGASVLGLSKAFGINTTTDTLGFFSSYASIPLTVPTGYFTVTLGVYPGKSWASAGEASATLFVLNPATLLFPGFGALFVIAAVARGRRRAQAVSGLEEEGGAAAPETRHEAEAVPAAQPSLLHLYIQALRLAERATGVTQSPSQTLREYLSLVRGRLRGYESFQYISLALEAQLYGEGASPEVEERARRELERLAEQNG